MSVTRGEKLYQASRLATLSKHSFKHLLPPTLPLFPHQLQAWIRWEVVGWCIILSPLVGGWRNSPTLTSSFLFINCCLFSVEKFNWYFKLAHYSPQEPVHIIKQKKVTQGSQFIERDESFLCMKPNNTLHHSFRMVNTWIGSDDCLWGKTVNRAAVW